MKLLKVNWLDASDPDDKEKSWFTQKDALEFAMWDTKIVSVGWEMVRNNHYLVLVADIGDQDDPKPFYGRMTKIPLGMIVDEEVLDAEG